MLKVKGKLCKFCNMVIFLCKYGILMDLIVNYIIIRLKWKLMYVKGLNCKFG